MSNMVSVRVKFSRFSDIGLGKGRDPELQLPVSADGLTMRSVIEHLRTQPRLHLEGIFGLGADSCQPASGVFIFVDDRQVDDIDAHIAPARKGQLEVAIVRLQAFAGG